MNIKLTSSQRRVLDSHTGPMGRRDFMGLGLKSFAGMVLAQPLFSRLAFGDSISNPPFIVFDLVGGAALSGNFLVGGKEGSEDLLPSYGTLGYNPRSAKMDKRFGLPAPKDISQMFEGMISVMSPGAQSGLKLTGIAHQSVDDVSNNKTSTLGLVARYWQKQGRLSQVGLGTFGTASGGNTQLSLDNSTLRPEQLADVSQLGLLSGLGYLKAEGFEYEQLQMFLNRQKNQFVRQYKEMSSPLQKNLKKQYERHFDTVLNSLNSVELDPRKVPQTQTLFGIDPQTSGGGEQVLSAGIAHSCFQGVVGPSCIALGGYDYHDNTQETGDGKDREAGELIGRVIELAHQMEKPFFFQILSDGACSANEGSRVWGADSGDRSMTIMGSYSPSGVTQVQTQIGHYTVGEIAELNTHVGRSPENVAQIVFLNYLSSIGKEGEISDFFSETDLPKSVIDQSIAFTKS